MEGVRVGDIAGGVDPFKPRSDLTHTTCFLWSMFIWAKVRSNALSHPPGPSLDKLVLYIPARDRDGNSPSKTLS